MNTSASIEFHNVSKRFCRTSLDSVRNASMKAIRHLVRLPPRQTLGAGEFWALRDIDLSVSRGECIGIIGPNGAGKSTLLKLINGDYRPDTGVILRRGQVTSLLRIGNGLHPLLSGRENIYLRLHARGLDKIQADRLLESIVVTAGLEQAVDRPVKHYSDGMYSRLEFALTTAVPLDILLIDEVLSVGDMAFQARSLERIRELKRQGTTVLMVSHSEMNIRWVADRCLLLFDGEGVGCGLTDELYRRYYQAVGFQHPLPTGYGASEWISEDCTEGVFIRALTCNGHSHQVTLHTSTPAEFDVGVYCEACTPELTLVLQFFGGRDELVACVDSGHHRPPGILDHGDTTLRVYLARLGLMPGVYRVAIGFRNRGRWVSYNRNRLSLTVKPGLWQDNTGPLQLQARIEWADSSSG